ncbi:MAG: tRNA-dihydrouridine synthase [Pseudomonadota bacterium]|uniref:tRNA dihydrouridine synthase n=1 Tax=Polaromonas sp. TaxID=1869339 RepID=UPI0017D694B7|nr:tRNA-dihydrouridine synthase [Polaromonas sp.]MBA3592819.1 tRNA-dihydrouridine synthase [Polaromonas sp.]MDQ3273098.1 tRNA-dihydrouridine synthase [Pseudomonadota bacterium]
MTILLAPMEGLLDFVLRDILTRAGGVDRCVSEFIRITDQLLPERVFLRIVPELLSGGRTLAGVPVRAQLLGSDPVCMAENAARLAALGPSGIDLNFGCPANIVNRHGGGAALLKEPETIAAIVAAVRRAVPAHMPVSAKMRLGYHDDALAIANAQAIAGSGADELVVHARTKAQAYRPPAYWERIADIRAAVAIPVVANGEIWTVDDARRCREASGCDMLMIGRGAVADPGLGRAIKRSMGVAVGPALGWTELVPLLAEFWQLVCSRLDARSRPGRLKQWLNFLRRRFPEAETAYQSLKSINDPALIDRWLAGVLQAQAAGEELLQPA